MIHPAAAHLQPHSTHSVYRTVSHTKATTQMLTLRLPCGLIMADAQNARNRLILPAPTVTTSGRGAPAIRR
ncbi:hypothetical protein DPMN_011954 [Dreissena polymorpha]|uniref:Uncharacterized protein n=1 Tax=Dreissena polymorpha TaxID=45954 RepID=A0A9D4N1H9_DREPO|nr:hypothetical protein DPMN_011954 [Dreissena polymorpha]